MSTTQREDGLDPCGCCEEPGAEPAVTNRPGLDALAYRLGTHASFLRRMQALLSSQSAPGAAALAALTTRAPDDPALALLDAWASVADVLTFYQERIANEGYLRTATERRSVLELARAIGYELSPGVAASAYLVFTVEDTPGAPLEATIAAGTQVQSIPAQGQLPQTFETGATFTARAAWNSLRPRLSQPQTLSGADDTLYLTTLDGEKVPASELYFAGTQTRLRPGELLLAAVPGESGLAVLPLRIRAVEADQARQLTRVAFEDSPQALPFRQPSFQPGRIVLDSLGFNQSQVGTSIQRQSWRQRDLSAFLAIQGWNGRALTQYLAAAPRPEPPAPTEGVFAFRARSGFFGHNAPRQETLPTPDETRDPGNDPYEEPWDGTSARSIWESSQGVGYTEADVYLERSIPEIVPGSWVIFEASGGAARQVYLVSATSEASLVDYSISAKSSGLQLATPDGGTLSKPTSLKVRKTTAYVQSERLELAELPIEEPIEAGATRLTLDGLVLDLAPGQQVALGGERDDLPAVWNSEVLTLKEILHEGGFTTLIFEQGLALAYRRATVVLNANVVQATHGETVLEALGSGNGAIPNQRFSLKKPPLTYVSAPTTSGTASTLAVRVNGVLWREAASLYGLDARSQAYIVRTEDDGTSRVTFGDGRQGARLPSGQENVVASYRSGLGSGGEVGAGSLSLLKTRPLGVRSVTNPLPAAGAEDPETLDAARANAPLTTRTLGRIVSLRDFEDFARAFAGVGKAQVAALWGGARQLIHITIASASGGQVDPASDVYKNLAAAIRAAGDPTQQVQIGGYQPLLFNLKAGVVVDPRYLAEDVLGAVEGVLRQRFAFARRGFSQPATASEIISAIQAVGGVIAVDVDELYLVTDDPAQQPPPTPAAFLAAEPARWQDGQIQPAQLLLLNPAGLTLQQKQVEL